MAANTRQRHTTSEGLQAHIWSSSLDGVLGQVILQKKGTPKEGPSWTDLIKFIRSFTRKNELLIAMFPKLEEDALVRILNESSAFLRRSGNYGKIATLPNPQARAAYAEYMDSVRKMKIGTRRILEKDMREMISRSTIARLDGQK